MATCQQRCKVVMVVAPYAYVATAMTSEIVTSGVMGVESSA